MSEIDLTNQLRRLASALPREAGEGVEQRLMAAFRSQHERRKRRWIWIATAALICMACLAGLTKDRRSANVGDDAYNPAGFIELPYAESGVPMESAVVIRVQMRPSELAAMGVALPAEASGARLNADLLVGQDGVPRAFRFVP